ncbi:MAG: polysaccharide deacetylase family protein [Clostridia bacterium]|nr:polysaccharide deacetylase family protein [Clostridia bacterium]
MSLKKQLIIFAAACLLFALLYAAFNILVDPFGVFGDVIFDYYEYNMTQNPRVAKIAYIDKYGDEYDSYIFGCSKSSSYPVEELNEYLDADFFNMFTYGGDLADMEKMALYVIENNTVKNLVLAIGPEAAYRYDSEEDLLKDNLHAKVDDSINPLIFYGKYLFCNPSYSLDKLGSYFGRSYLPDASNVFIAETGAYNKIRRDTMPISDIDSYYADMAGAEFDITYSRPLDYIDEALQSVANIKRACDEKEINFILIGSPMYDAEIACYDKAELAEFTTRLAEITDFYNFWGYNAFSHDPRFFYDGYHFRNCVGSAALGYIFGNEEIYIPESFGTLTTSETADYDLMEMNNEDFGSEELTVKVPILMYHALTEDAAEANDVIITAEAFEEQIAALTEAGYTAVFYDDLRSYVNYGKALPDNPILITFDDGYSSNIDIALPILKKYGQCGTVAVIGVSMGKETYKDTGESMHPHFSIEEAKEAYELGILDFQSHTYDMHQTYLDTDPRTGVLPREDESEKEYITALAEDFIKSKELMESGIGNEVFVITYPHGKYTELSEAVLAENGAEVSVTIKEGINEITKGLPQSLRGLRRFNMTDSISGDALLRMLTEYIYD